MWRGNEECNEDGEPVRLYQPIQYGRSNIRADDSCASYIGGPISATHQCPNCGLSLVTLVQLHIPTTDRTLRVLACNSAACFRSLFATSKFQWGGNGVVVCERLRANDSASAGSTGHTAKPLPKVNSKPVDDDEDEDDWGVSGHENDTGDTGLDDLEAKLAAMTAAKSAQPSPPKQSTSKLKTTTSSNEPVAGLPMMALASLREPPPRTVAVDARDVGLHGTSNQKIEEMLARYMQDEEDQNLVQMLKGTMSTGAGGLEADEDLTEEEMALLRFTDRLKRSPHQVLRYAYRGEPLWSVPYPIKTGSNLKRKGAKESNDASQIDNIPSCSCGAPRVFECQILPSVLHVLNVDKHIQQSSSKTSHLNDWYSNGGMDFGSIAVYTCTRPDSCASAREFVVVQDTAEEQPKAPPMGYQDVGDIVVDENAAALNPDEDTDDVMEA